MTAWWEGPLAPFDIESGGVRVESDGVVTVTVATVGKGIDTDVWSGLIAVDFDIDPGAVEVHGITTEYARANGQPAAQVLDEAAARLSAALNEGIPVVGSNMPYDFTILDRNCRRCGVPTVTDRLHGQPIAPVVDILTIDRRYDRYRPGSRKLEALCAQYGVKHGGAHDATEDALAAARVAYVMGCRSQMSFRQLRNLYADRRYPERIARDWQTLGDLTLPELHAAQIGWYREQSLGLAAYWRQTAQQKRTEAGRDIPPGDDDLGPDERRKVLLAESDELETRAAGVDVEWPIRPYRNDVSAAAA